MGNFFETLRTASPAASVIISMAFMLSFGFLMTRLTKLLRLPNVTAYILAGILIGPWCLHLVPQSTIDNTDFLSDIALAFIAFSAGEFFKVDALKKNGRKVVVITVLEACLASIAVFIPTYFLLHLSLSFSIVLAALASATAPASTMMTIRQTGARGDFVDTLLPIVALTAAALVSEREEALGEGMNDFLTKPIYPHRLRTALVRLLRPADAPRSL